MKKITRKILSALIVSAIILASVFVAIPVSATGNTAFIANDFSEGNYMPSDKSWQHGGSQEASVVDGVFQIQANQGYGTSGATFFPSNTDGSGQNGNNYLWVNADTTVQFLVKYKYKFAASARTVNIRFSLRKNNELWTSYGTSDPFEISADAGNADNTWHNASYIVSIPVSTTGGVWLGVNPRISSSWQYLYLDDLEIYLLNNGENFASTVTFEDGNGNVIASESGLVGDSITTANPTKTGCTFEGWYADEDYSEEFSGAFAAEDITVYAKWEATPIITNTLENVYNDGKNFAFAANANASAAVEEGVGYNDSKGIRVTANADHATLSWRLCNDDGSHIAYQSLAQNDMRTFMVKYKYKCDDTGNTGIYVHFRFQHYNDWPVCSDGNNPFIIRESKGNADDGWREVSYLTTLTLSNSSVVSKYPSLCMYIYLYNMNDTVYFDDVEIYDVTELEAGTLNFVDTSNGIYLDPVAGLAGNPFDIADTDFDLTYDAGEGLSFAGYCTDEDCTIPWNGKFGSGETTLYSYYQPIGGYNTITEDYERYTTSSIAANFGSTTSTHGDVSIVNENGNNVLRYTVKDGVDRTIDFRPNYILKDSDGSNLDQALAKGNTYYALLTYKYKIVAAYDDYGVTLKPMLIDEALESLGNDTENSLRFGNATRSFMSGVYLSNIKDNNWHTATVALSFTPSSDVYAGFGFQFDAGKRNCDVYFDDITITFLPHGTKSSTVCVPLDMGSLKFDFTAGVVGNDVMIGESTLSSLLPTNIYKRGKKFSGYKLNDVAFNGKFPTAKSNIVADFSDLSSIYDYNDDNAVNILDLVKLKKNFANETGYVVSEGQPAALLAEIIHALISLDTNKTFAGVDGNYILAWNDEFDTLNTDNWNINTSEYERTLTYESNGLGAIENDDYTVRFSASNLAVNNGVLQISSSIDKTNKVITGGEINSKYKASMKYGYVEARIKLQKKSNIEGFWLNGSGMSESKIHSEFDIIETLGKFDEFRSNIHYWNGNKTSEDGSEYHQSMSSVLGDSRIQSVENIDSEYHIFGLLITPTVVKFYLDGVCYCETTFAALEEAASGLGYTNVMDCPLYFILGTSVYIGYYDYSDWIALETNTASPMCVDYIRVYQNPTTDTIGF